MAAMGEVSSFMSSILKKKPVGDTGLWYRCYIVIPAKAGIHAEPASATVYGFLPARK
ncbi:hypothetical protein GCM10027277_32960 [Pseudoduganella ginsengisoli]